MTDPSHSSEILWCGTQSENYSGGICFGFDDSKGMWVRDIYFVEDFAFRTYMVVDPVIRSISDVYHNEDITVANGTALVDVGLPTKVGVNLSDGDSIPIWT